MDLQLAHNNMIEQQIRPWQVNDAKILDLLKLIPRANFVITKYQNLAYADLELPLVGTGHMLSPKIEARLLQELQLSKTDKVLEIGSGSGFVSTLLAKLSDFVYSVELNPSNKAFALNNLINAGVKNISLIEGDGSFGLLNKAPFDKIFVGGALPFIPSALKQQLKTNGRMVAIIGNLPIMHTVLIEKTAADEYTETILFETAVEYLHAPHLTNFNL